MNNITDRSKNITFPQLRLRLVMIVSKWILETTHPHVCFVQIPKEQLIFFSLALFSMIVSQQNFILNH